MTVDQSNKVQIVQMGPQNSIPSATSRQEHGDPRVPIPMPVPAMGLTCAGGCGFLGGYDELDPHPPSRVSTDVDH